MDQSKPKDHHFRLLIIIVFIVFVGLLTFLIFSQTSKRPIPFGGIVSKAQMTSIPTLTVTRGALSISIIGDSRHSLSDYLILKIIANSQNIDVVGYDIILSYNNDVFDLVRVESAQPSFEIYKTSLADHLSLTGIKKSDRQVEISGLEKKSLSLSFSQKNWPFYL